MIDDASFEAKKLSQTVIENKGRIHGDIRQILARAKEIDNVDPNKDFK